MGDEEAAALPPEKRLVHLYDTDAVVRMPSDAGRVRGEPALTGAQVQRIVTAIEPSPLDVCADGRVGMGRACSSAAEVEEALAELRPWRKGPFRMGGVDVDAEWDARRKWERILPLVRALPRGLWADVGAGNGWYAWHLLGQGARVVTFEPWALARAQHEVAALACDPSCWWGRLAISPAGIESMEPWRGVFDAVLLMGVLYHRTDPFETLRAAAAALRPGGRILLETIVVPGEEPAMLIPPTTYAGARGFWTLPTMRGLEAIVRRCDLHIVERIAPTATNVEEQRATAWSGPVSLQDGLDPTDASRTIEGLPAPLRTAMLLARGARG